MDTGHSRRASRRGAPVSDAARGVAYAVVRRSLDSGAYADRAIDGEATRAGLDARGPCVRVVPRARNRAAPAHARCGDRARGRALAGPPRASAAARPAPRCVPAPVRQASVPDRAAVSETVELVRTVVGPARDRPRERRAATRRERGPAWLDVAAARTPPRRPASGTRCPTGLCRLWFDAYGRERALRACAAPRTCRLAVVLRPNPLRAGPGEVEAAAEAAGVESETDATTGALVIAGPFDLAGSELYERGLVVAQSLGSIAVVDLVGAAPGERVLDLCAAPGGKTAGLAAGGARRHGRREQLGAAPRRCARRSRGSASTRGGRRGRRARVRGRARSTRSSWTRRAAASAS